MNWDIEKVKCTAILKKYIGKVGDPDILVAA
jgi:hypothetical protein